MRLAGEGSALYKKCGVYLQVVGVARIPLNYEGRLTEVFEKPSITFVCLLSTHSETSSTGQMCTVKDLFLRLFASGYAPLHCNRACHLQIPAEGIRQLHLSRRLALNIKERGVRHEHRDALCARRGYIQPVPAV